jgi:hypothetical protein
VISTRSHGSSSRASRLRSLALPALGFMALVLVALTSSIPLPR